MGSHASRPAIALRRELRVEAPPSALWPLISNTDRFNRSLGLPAVTLEAPSPGEFNKRVRARLLGMSFSWQEMPFEWAEGRFFRVIREFDFGPIERFEGGMTLTADTGGTRVTMDSAFTPRNAFGALVVRMMMGRRPLADAEAMLRRFEASLTQGGEAFPAQRTKSVPHAAALAQKTQELRQTPVDRDIASKLLHHIDHAYDDELSRMRPFELADAWGFPRLDGLRTFLYSTKAGLLDMNWEIACPNCAAPSSRPAALSELRNTAHCNTCAADYNVNFDDSVELRFSVNPTVRAVEAHTFCVGNPAQTPFAVFQLFARAGQPRAAEAELGSESFVLRDLKTKKHLRLRPDPAGPAEVTVDLARLEDGGDQRFKPGLVKFLLRPGPEAALVRLERESWKDRGAKASAVTALQEFRDLFSSEVLAPGMEIGVKTLAVLFSDLKGSTALYESIGDATAYALVRDHFSYIFDIVRRHDGAVVKTIGDAVMAVFAKGRDAVAAALEIQDRLDTLNDALAPKPPVVIKLGAHQGASIAINADGVLDYFGTTVNVAARVQHESQGGDIVLSQALAGDKSVQELLAGRRLHDEPFEIKLKGLSDVFCLHRLRLAPHA